MIAAPFPADEDARLAALLELRILDTPAEERFDRITRIARDQFQVPIALISLVDAERQWFKSKIGIAASETPREVSFCAHAILGAEPFVIENALQDVRFEDNPLVTGEPHLRFYAGIPLASLDGRRLGTLCLIDRQPRAFGAAERQRLCDLAAIAELELNHALAFDAQLKEMRSGFVRLVSHELRTPLTSLVASLHLIKRHGDAAPASDSMLDYALASAAQLNRTINAIVEMAEIEEGIQRLAPSAIDLREYLPPLLSAHAEADTHGQSRIELSAGPAARIHAAPAALARILGALLSNALRFSPPESPVRVSFEQKDAGTIRLCVADRGAGIAAADVGRLFWPFMQVDASDTRRHDGIGISLAICHRLACAMNARLGYAPNPQGGSVFFIDLPAAPQP